MAIVYSCLMKFNENILSALFPLWAMQTARHLMYKCRLQNYEKDHGWQPVEPLRV